jgi:Tub family
MVRPDDDKTIFLLHGKVGRNVFNLDFRPPLNILQAFSISMVSISSKFLVS